MKKVFTEKLPKYTEGQYANKINWKESIGHKVKFVYNHIEDEVEIIKYECPYITILYKNNTLRIATYSFLRCSLGVFIGEIRKEYFYNIGDIVKTNTGEIQILTQIRKIVQNSTIRGYKYKCILDGYEGEISEYDLKNGHGCSGCSNKVVRKGIDDIHTKYPYLLRYFIDVNDAYNYSPCSDVFLEFKCPDCGYIKKIQIKTFVKFQGFICPKCGDGISYPEKFMFNFLEQLDVIFNTQYNPIWAFSKKYDFYIPDYNVIIETNGEQHYTNSFGQIGSKTVEETQVNDNTKFDLAMNNNISEYIIIDCRKSNLDWIKNNIINSKLSNLFDLSNIDWNKCHEFACNSRVKEVSELWNNAIHSTADISKITNLHRSTIRRYLKLGRSLGWNDYDEIIAKKSGGISQKKQVICLNTLEIFESSKEVQEKYNIHKTDVWRLCHNKGNFISVNYQPYVFMYYDDYLKLNHTDIENKLNKGIAMYLKSPSPKRVICLNTLEIYGSLKEASESNNVLYVGISQCCRNINNYAGKLEDGSKMLWMYYDEYITKTKDEIDIIINNSKERKIICITTNKIFESIDKAGKYYNIENFNSNIYRVLSNKRGHCGVLNGEKLKWAYYDEYIINSNNTYENKTNAKNVLCVETGETYKSVASLSKQSKDIFNINLTENGISRVCRGERDHYKGYHFKYI